MKEIDDISEMIDDALDSNKKKVNKKLFDFSKIFDKRNLQFSRENIIHMYSCECGCKIEINVERNNILNHLYPEPQYDYYGTSAIEEIKLSRLMCPKCGHIFAIQGDISIREIIVKFP